MFQSFFINFVASVDDAFERINMENLKLSIFAPVTDTTPPFNIRCTTYMYGRDNFIFSVAPVEIVAVDCVAFECGGKF